MTLRPSAELAFANQIVTPKNSTETTEQIYVGAP